MERKNKQSAARAARREDKTVIEAMKKWCKDAKQGETRSTIIISCTEKNGRLTANAHINGHMGHLTQATEAMMAGASDQNPAGRVMFHAAAHLFERIAEQQAAQETAQNEQPQDQTHNDNE